MDKEVNDDDGERARVRLANKKDEEGIGIE